MAPIASPLPPIGRSRGPKPGTAGRPWLAQPTRSAEEHEGRAPASRCLAAGPQGCRGLLPPQSVTSPCLMAIEPVSETLRGAKAKDVAGKALARSSL